ncbi:MAG: hypothetical protein HFJ46_06095 [Clostridia bacterium]|nr:hypothetical protein [Clostridia bacterium]
MKRVITVRKASKHAASKATPSSKPCKEEKVTFCTECGVDSLFCEYAFTGGCKGKGESQK